MFLLTKSIIVVSILVTTMAATLNVPKKCDLTDNECKKVMYQTIFRKVADGIPNLNIPAADPMILKNGVSTLPNSLKLTLEDGIATGFKDCSFDKLQTYLEEPFHTTVNLTCDVEVNGKYKVEVPKSVMEELEGEDLNADVITGSGTGKVKFDKLHLLLNVPFDFEWKDKDIYLVTKNIQIYHDAHDTVVFSIENLDVDQKVNSEKIANYLKNKAIELNLMAPITEKIQEFFIVFMEKYVSRYPAKDLFTSDLSSLT